MSTAEFFTATKLLLEFKWQTLHGSFVHLSFCKVSQPSTWFLNKCRLHVLKSTQKREGGKGGSNYLCNQARDKFIWLKELTCHTTLWQVSHHVIGYLGKNKAFMKKLWKEEATQYIRITIGPNRRCHEWCCRKTSMPAGQTHLENISLFWNLGQFESLASIAHIAQCSLASLISRLAHLKLDMQADLGSELQSHLIHVQDHSCVR